MLNNDFYTRLQISIISIPDFLIEQTNSANLPRKIMPQKCWDTISCHVGTL